MSNRDQLSDADAVAVTLTDSAGGALVELEMALRSAKKFAVALTGHDFTDGVKVGTILVAVEDKVRELRDELENQGLL